MTDSLEADLEMLYEELLKLAGKEEQALTADNLDELEACICRKEEIVRKLRQVEEEQGHRWSSETSEKVARLLDQIVTRQERVRDGIEVMLNECQETILEIRAGQRAYRAYHRDRKKGRERSARLL
jgi:flagellin-specific chaperone FliS